MKTAEEILKESGVYMTDFISSSGHAGAIDAIHKFADHEVAKEVEAYKKRLIAEIRSDVRNSGPTMLRGDIAILIDTTK